MNFLRHDHIARYFLISGKIQTINRLHMGGSRLTELFEEADTNLIRINDKEIEVPYIPGSSLKGIFRSTIEYILNSIGEDVCFLKRDSNCATISKKIMETSENKSSDNPELLEFIDKLCLPCKIFGSNNYYGHVSFFDSIPVDPLSIKSDISQGIAINRRDGTTMPRALFTYEHINPHSSFNFQIKIQNLPNYLIGLIFKVIELINKGIVLIGGKKRAGLGEVTIFINNITFYDIKKPEKNFEISKQQINHVSKNKIILEAIDDDRIRDFSLTIDLENLKSKNENEFSNIIIKSFTKIWDDYVKNR